MRKFSKRLLAVTALTASLATIVLLVMSLRSSRHIEARLAPLRAAGKPLSIAELEPEPVPDEQNAAVVLKSLLPAFDRYVEIRRNVAESADEDETNDEVDLNSAAQFLANTQRW